MSKLFIATAVLAFFTTSAVLAEAPASAEDCLKLAFDIAQAAENKSLPNEELDKVEEMLMKMESYCDARQFTEAAAVASDLKTMISKE